MNTSSEVTTSAVGRDLILTAVIDAPASRIFEAWTDPQQLAHWFAPRPFTLPECEIDARPGGILKGLMRDPDGNEYPIHGVFLEVVPNEKLVSTDAYTSAWELSDKPFMTSIVTLEDLGGGKTRYTATARHWSMDDLKTHEQMGFHEGWKQCLEQLIDHLTKS